MTDQEVNLADVPGLSIDDLHAFFVALMIDDFTSEIFGAVEEAIKGVAAELKAYEAEP